MIQPETADSGSTVSWEGKLNQLKKSLEESSDSHINHLTKLDKNLDKLFANAIEDKLRPLEDKINSKIMNVDQRLTQIF